MAVTASNVQSILKTSLTAADINTCITLAGRITARIPAAAALTTAQVEDIQLYLAAHICTFKNPQGRLTTLAVDDIRQTFGGEYGSGLRASMYGQMALMLDTSGTLAGLDDTRPVAVCELWCEDYDTGDITADVG